jgi:VanZ like family
VNTTPMRFVPIKIESWWPAMVWLILSTIAFCLPGKALPDQDWFALIQLDKWIHIGLFSVMIVLWCLPFLVRRSAEQVGNLFIYISIGWFGYGVAMELIQHYFISNRSFDSGDIAADALGCLLGFLFVKKQQQLFTR